MSRFAPVHLPEGAGPNGRVRQTALRHYAACPRSGYLYFKYEGQVKTPEMMRGSGLHAVRERMVRTMLESGEVTIPPEIVKVIVNEVLADPQFAIPFEEHDYLREMSYRLAAETIIDPRTVIALESLFVMQLGGYEVRCRLDFAELLEDGRVCHVEDYKSSRAAPSYEEVARKTRDGRLMAKNFQLVLQALLLAFGVPVREEVGADGEVIEIPDEFPVAARAQEFLLEFVYPGLEDSEEKMLRRPVTLTRAELDEYRESLIGLLARLAHSEKTGEWDAVRSASGCGECPCPAECPMPRELRDGLGELRTDEDAASAADLLDALKAEVRVVGGLVRDYVKERGPVYYGLDRVAEVAHETAEKFVDREGMFVAMDRAVRYGDPFDRADFVRSEERFPLKLRQLTVDEIEDNSEVPDGE